MPRKQQTSKISSAPAGVLGSVKRPETPQVDSTLIEEIKQIAADGGHDSLSEVALFGKTYPFMLTAGAMMRIQDELEMDPMRVLQALQELADRGEFSLRMLYPLAIILYAGIAACNPAVTMSEILNRLDFPASVGRAFALIFAKMAEFGQHLDAVAELGPGGLKDDELAAILGEARAQATKK